MVVMASGTITRRQADQVPCLGRRTQGRTLVQTDAGDRVVEVTRAYSDGTGRQGKAEGPEEPREPEGQREPERQREPEGREEPGEQTGQETGDAASVAQLDLLE